MTAQIVDLEPEERSYERRGLRRGIYLLPNLLTISSLFCGVSSLIRTLNGEYDVAAWLIFLSAVFDALDGTVARVTRTQSLFGQELDSLSDVVAFGVAPGLLMFLWALQPFGNWGLGAGFLYIACTALRLARFNVQSGTVERTHFQGIPSPGAAIMIAATVLLYYDMGGEGSPSRHITLLIECYALALLMVSNIPYLSSKALHLESVKAFQTLILVVFLLTLLAAEPTRTLFGAVLLYVLSGLVLQLRRLFGRGEPVSIAS